MQARALEILPGKPFSYDNYLSMQIDSLCGKNGLEELDIHPTDIDTVVPAFLGSKSQRQRYQELRTDYWGFSRNDSRRL
jgi:NADH dehydrogenase